MTYVSVPTPVNAPAPVGAAARIGTVAWIVGAAQFLLMNGVAQAAWTTPYSLAHNNISDLGAVSCRVRWFTVTIGLVALAGVWLHFQWQFGVLGLGGSERLAVFPLQVWTLVAGGLLLMWSRARRPSVPPAIRT